MSLNSQWNQNGITVAGGNGAGSRFNQLRFPHNVYVDDNQTVYVADAGNGRIMKWKRDATTGQVVAAGNGKNDNTNQLYWPTAMIIDRRTDSLIICDKRGRRVLQWPRRNGKSGYTIINNIKCYGLMMDDEEFLYVSDETNNEVRRWRIGEARGTVVAGGNGKGDRLDQLNNPSFIFVDQDHSVYVADWGNDRVMKWMQGAKKGIIVAGGQGEGNALTQLHSPEGVVVDDSGTVYVADFGNHRIMSWPKGSKEGCIVVGENGEGDEVNQLKHPIGLSFDRRGNLYVVDWGNSRVQKFCRH